MSGKLPEVPQSQSEKFQDLARKLDADEDEKAFEGTVRRVAKAPAPKPPKPAA